MEQRKVFEIESLKGGHTYRGVPQNGDSSFIVPIVYVQPKFDELLRRFPAFANPAFKGMRFDPIESCKGVPTNVGSREVAFEYFHINQKMTTEEVLAEMDHNGLRPALYEELLGFAEKYPDEQEQYWIVALGSETEDVYCIRSVAVLCDIGDGRDLILSWSNDDWDASDRFLAVRK